MGLVLEGPELWHEISSVVSDSRLGRRFQLPPPNQSTVDRAKLLAALGWLFIVAGVAGEYVADTFVSKADGYVQTFDEILLTEAQSQTAFATERASAAYERAAETEKETAQENERAAKAERQAQEENERAAQTLQAAEIARKQAEGLRFQIAQANERAANAELESARLKAKMADRSLDEMQKNLLVADLKSFSGTTIDVATFGDSAEISGVATSIGDCLKRAGWIVHLAAAMAGQGTVKGIVVGTRANSDPTTAQAARSLIQSLQRQNLSAGPWAFEKMPWPSAYMGEGNGEKYNARIRMFIGSKP